MRLIHIAACLLALAAGAVALLAAKGSPLHRKSGRVFVAAMLIMTASAAMLAIFVVPNRVNVVAAVPTFYPVCTALLTVTRQAAEIRAVTVALMLVALLTARAITEFGG